jgi:hypothetical protein
MIALDKQAHFWAGLAICLGVSLFFGPWVGLAVSVVAGIGKEVIDSLGYGTPDKWDGAATIFGSVLGVILFYISEALV